jgi:hypothetical protein
MHTQTQTKKVHGFMDGQSPTIPMPALRLAAVSAIVLGALALFAPDAAAQLAFCADGNINGSQFVTYTNSILTVIMFGGLFLGTIAIVIGFASKSAPFISSDKADWIKKGLIFGWGLPIAVYALKIVGIILSLDVDCLFPV